MVDPVVITALDDPRVDVYRDVRDADLRGRDRLFMAESELVVRRLLRTPQRLHSLFLSRNKFERLGSAIDEAYMAGGSFPIYLAEVELISDIAGFHIHRGALAAGFRPTGQETGVEDALIHLDGREEFTLLFAEGITNVDNMGGLFRNAAAFGVDGIVLDPTCCDPLYRKAIRVSVGHTLSVPYGVSKGWISDLLRMKERWGLTFVGAESPDAVTSRDGLQPLWEMPRSRKIGLMFGSEAMGLSVQARGMCDVLVEVPMATQVSSLNVATAAAVVLYELRRGEARP